MAEILWFRPVCDNILTKIHRWHEDYFHGPVYASKPFLTKEGRVVDKATIHEYKIKFTALEISHLVRILRELLPNHDATDQMIKVEEAIKARKLKLTPPNLYEVPLMIYRDQVADIHAALVQAKTGVANIKDTIKDQKEEGKAPFEF